MDTRALIRGSMSGTPPQKRPVTTARSSKLLARPASLGEPKRQHMMRVERVLQIHRDWVARHGRTSASDAIR